MSEDDKKKKVEPTDAASTGFHVTPISIPVILGGSGTTAVTIPITQGSLLNQPVTSPLSLTVSDALRDQIQQRLESIHVVDPSILKIPYGFTPSDVLVTYPSSSKLWQVQSPNQERLEELETEAKRLKNERDKFVSQLRTASKDVEAHKRQYAELQSTVDKLKSTQRLRRVLDKVAQDFQPLILDRPELQKEFESGREWQAAVLAIDIRRSTELMLKARSAEDFAAFITEICDALRQIVVSNYGVFDKFTGDGVLAAFPEEFSGPDAIGYALKSATEAHALFQAVYEKSRKRFTSIAKDVGLGIGIDYGSVHLVRVCDDLTVVGEPVVYACRFSGIPPKTTVLNQRAYEMARNLASASARFNEVIVPLKHEGDFIAYSAEQTAPLELRLPTWAQREKAAEGSAAD